MPSMESSFMWTKKQDDICGVGVPALKSVGLPPHESKDAGVAAAQAGRHLRDGHAKGKCQGTGDQPGVREELLRHVIVGLDGERNVALVDAHGDSHQHVLGNAGVGENRQGPCPMLRA
jgi:hypothetical protein